MNKIGCTVAFLAMFGVFSAVIPAGTAQAQAQPIQVTSTAKGVIGLGLIGAELGFVIPAVAGLDQTWAFVVFPVVGAAAGGITGYFALESGGGSPELAVASLATGMALVIPAMVITLSSTAYDPDDEPTRVDPADEQGEDVADDEEGLQDNGGNPPAEAAPAGNSPAEANPPATPAGGQPQSRRGGPRFSANNLGIVRMTPNGIAVGVPAVSAVPMYSAEEIRQYGVEQRTEVRVPVVTAVF